jgi:hypothetical protein
VRVVDLMNGSDHYREGDLTLLSTIRAHKGELSDSGVRQPVAFFHQMLRSAAFGTAFEPSARKTSSS